MEKPSIQDDFTSPLHSTGPRRSPIYRPGKKTRPYQAPMCCLWGYSEKDIEVIKAKAARASTFHVRSSLPLWISALIRAHGYRREGKAWGFRKRTLSTLRLESRLMAKRAFRRLKVRVDGIWRSCMISE